MFETTNKWLSLAEKNKTLVLLWSTLVACLVYSINIEADLTEKRAALRNAAATIEGLQTEQEESREMIKIWDDCLKALIAHAETYSASLTPDRLASENITATTNNTIDEYRSDRQMISGAMGKINNFYFSLPANQELRTKLLADLTSADEITQRRIVFMQTMLTDMKKANEMAPTITSDIDEQRKVVEASTRWDYIENVNARSVREFNTQVRNFNERRKVLGREEQKSILAYIYIGACVGGSLGWLFSRRKAIAAWWAQPTKPTDDSVE